MMGNRLAKQNAFQMQRIGSQFQKLLHGIVQVWPEHALHS